MSAPDTRRTGRLNLRASAHENALIRAAAELRGVSVSEFILESACAGAERTLADRRHFVVPDDRMAEFIAALDRPAKANPRLKRLLAEPGLLD